MSGTSRNRSKARPAGRQARQSQTGLMTVLIISVVVIALIGGFILYRVNTSSNSSSSSTSALAPPALVKAVTSVPTSILTQVGYQSSALPLPKAIPHAKPLMHDGKPDILYMGAEYCPYCAAERWPMIVALSKFGTFTNLRTTTSSTTDVFPSTNTFSFIGSSYTSPYISFSPVEEYSNQPSNGFYSPLQKPTTEQNTLINTYDQTTYSGTTSGSIPFVDFANKYMVVGATFSPQVLQGLNWDTIAGSLTNTSTLSATAVDGTANMIIATICKLTNDQPSKVCSTPLISSIESQLPKHK